jgi:hypothetical protein
MTPLEDKVRQAFQEKAGQVRLDVAPPLRLPARRRRFPSLAYGGGQRRGAPAGRGWLAPAASAVLVAAVIAGSVAASQLLHGQQRPGHSPGPAAGQSSAVSASYQAAAAWVAAQVSPNDIVSCDLAMCRALEAHGVSVSNLLPVEPGSRDLLESQIIVSTATIRNMFGSRLDSVYAPTVLASFGSGKTRIDVRVIAPDGAAAYVSALRADVQERKSMGAQLSSTQRIVLAPTARRQMDSGQVDAQLLIVITALAAVHPVDILAFGDSGPGASAGMPLRSVYLADNGGAATMRAMLAILHQQQGDFRPTRAETAPFGRRPALFIEFSAPSPLGLLNGSGQ